METAPRKTCIIKVNHLLLLRPKACPIDKELQQRKSVSTTQRTTKSWLNATSRILGRKRTAIDMVFAQKPTHATIIMMTPPIHHFQSRNSCNDEENSLLSWNEQKPILATDNEKGNRSFFPHRRSINMFTILRTHFGDSLMCVVFHLDSFSFVSVHSLLWAWCWAQTSADLGAAWTFKSSERHSKYTWTKQRSGRNNTWMTWDGWVVLMAFWHKF